MISKFIKHLNKSNSVYYCTKPSPKNKLYSNTVLLPKTKFPLRLENKKLIERDAYIYNAAEFENLYSWQRSHLSEPEFVLHDGPPYANGQPHMGHAINKILKDTILRYHILNGNKVHYVPGWDCHGLPIELKAIFNSAELSPIEVRSKARKFANDTVEAQKAVFKSWGLVGDWKNAYKTSSSSYVKTQFRLFYKMYKKGLIYRDFKPIYWSPSSRTALAESELEYNENHKSPSVYVRFEVREIPKLKVLKDKRVYAIIWTTTPWTLPSNQAVCYNETLSYSLVKKPDPLDNDVYIIATDLLESVSASFNCNFQLLNVLSGDLLEGATYHHPIYKQQILPFLNGTHVAVTKGTGLVHTAPAHGPDDFLVALNNKISVVDLVNEEGRFKKETGPNLEGKYVLSDGTQEVLQLVKSDVMSLGEITHSYPYDWRTKQPVIIRASKQWFIDTNAIKNRAAELLESVQVLPRDKSEVYKKSLLSQIRKRPYWCISRQRKWGVPIPVFYDKNTSEIVINENIISHFCNLLETNGPDFWWKLDVTQLLPKNLHNSSPEHLQKGEDIMDIWLDSGVSWATVLEGDKVADLYLEGVDQFNGWFQSSLLTSAALRDKSPYRTVYVHGYAVDEKGVKMSKSLGNVVDPLEITGGDSKRKPYGVDVLRWWVACHANQASLANVSPAVLQSSVEEVQKIRSVLRFALGVLTEYECLENDRKRLYLVDKYILHLLYRFHNQVSEAVKEYNFHKVSHLVINLLTNPISALYYTAVKDRLYCEAADSVSRRGVQYTLTQVFNVVTRAIAPIVPHLAEEMHLYLPQRQKTFFTTTWTPPDPSWKDENVEKLTEIVLKAKRDVNKLLTAGNSLDAEVFLSFSPAVMELMNVVTSRGELEEELTDVLQVAKVAIGDGSISGDFTVSLSKSLMVACPRCRRVRSERRDELCGRCSVVVGALSGDKTVASN